MSTQAISTAVDLLQFSMNVQVGSTEASAELAQRFAAKLDAGQPWTAADTQSWFDWLDQRVEDAAAGKP